MPSPEPRFASQSPERGVSAPVPVDIVLAAAFPRLITCLDSDSKTDITKVGDGVRGAGAGADAAGRASAPATPRDRNIWEDVLSVAASLEARSLLMIVE